MLLQLCVVLFQNKTEEFLQFHIGTSENTDPREETGMHPVFVEVGYHVPVDFVTVTVWQVYPL